MNIEPGKQLFTRDGRQVGNGIVVGEQEHMFSNLGKVWVVETDFGNTMNLTERELEQFYYLDFVEPMERDLGEPMERNLNRWRWDRFKNVVNPDKLETMLENKS